MRSIVVTTIEDYIIKAQYEKAFEYMKEAAKELLKTTDLYNDLLELQSRYNKLKQQKMKNTMDSNAYLVESAKINETLIEYKSRIEKLMEEKDSEGELVSPELELLIYTNAFAYTIKDIDMVSKTLHSEIKGEILAVSQQVFANRLELLYAIKSIEITELAEDFATANVVQTTSKKDPNTLFRNNELKMNHTFTKEDGRWKIFSSLMQEIKYF